MFKLKKKNLHNYNTIFLWDKEGYVYLFDNAEDVVTTTDGTFVQFYYDKSRWTPAIKNVVLVHVHREYKERIPKDNVRYGKYLTYDPDRPIDTTEDGILLLLNLINFHKTIGVR